MKAFLRLQSKIIKKTPDDSIFAWTSHDFASGMLATHPRFFANTGDLIWDASYFTRPQASITNRGLEFSVPRLDLCGYSHAGSIPVYLNCVHEASGYECRFACIQIYFVEDKVYRIRCWNNMPEKYPQQYQKVMENQVLKDWHAQTEVICVSSPKFQTDAEMYHLQDHVNAEPTSCTG